MISYKLIPALIYESQPQQTANVTCNQDSLQKGYLIPSLKNLNGERNASQLVAWLLFQLFWSSFSSIYIGGKLLPRQEGEKETYDQKHKTQKPSWSWKRTNNYKRYWLFCFSSTKTQEIKFSFYCHPFYLQVKSNARSKFLKAFMSFFKGERGNFQKLKLVFIQRCLVQFMVQIVNLALKSGLTYFQV